MIKIRDAYLNTEDYDFQINRQGIVQLSFGPTHVCMSLDSAYDLQYRLAAFLAYLELKEYPPERDDEDQGVMEGRQTLESLASYRKSKRLDA